MFWNNHNNLEGTHAFFGASNYHWLNWPNDILWQRYYGQYAVDIGTSIHELAKDCILNKTRLNKQDRHLIDYVMFKHKIPKESYDAELILANLLPYVNDAIGFRMSPEILLYYSTFCYGTADAILFNEKEKMLRIHDLKTGTVPAHMEQLLIYSALFCLEYKKKPTDFSTELRIYQNGEIAAYIPLPEEIYKIMDIITAKVKIIQDIKEQEVR